MQSQHTRKEKNYLTLNASPVCVVFFAMHVAPSCGRILTIHQMHSMVERLYGYRSANTHIKEKTAGVDEGQTEAVTMLICKATSPMINIRDSAWEIM